MKTKIDCGCEKDVFVCRKHCKPQHTPTPLAVAIYQAMGMYKAGFGEEMHGTYPQIVAMLEFGPMKSIARSVNAHKGLIGALKCAVDELRGNKRHDVNHETVAVLCERAIAKAEAKS